LERIFDRCYRLDSSRGLRPGYGLGLPVARELVDRWGGKIWGERRAGATRFLVRLPLAKEKERGLRRPVRKMGRPAGYAGGPPFSRIPPLPLSAAGQEARNAATSDLALADSGDLV